SGGWWTGEQVGTERSRRIPNVGRAFHGILRLRCGSPTDQPPFVPCAAASAHLSAFAPLRMTGVILSPLRHSPLAAVLAREPLRVAAAFGKGVLRRIPFHRLAVIVREVDE